MFPEVKKITHRFCSSKGIFDSVITSFIVTVFFIIYLILFYVIKRLRCFNEKKLFLHDFYVMRQLFLLFHHCPQKKPTKCFKGVVSVPFIGSLCTHESGTVGVWQGSSVAGRLSAGENTNLSSWVSISCSALEVKTLSLTGVIILSWFSPLLLVSSLYKGSLLQWSLPHSKILQFAVINFAAILASSKQEEK